MYKCRCDEEGGENMWSGVDGKFQPYLGLGNNSSRTFHEHPEEVGECKVVQQRHEDDAAR